MKKLFIYSAILLSVYSFTLDNNISIKGIKYPKYDNVIQVDAKFNKVDTLYISLKEKDGSSFFEETVITDHYNRKFSLDVDDSNINDTLSLEIKTNKGEKITKNFVPGELVVK